MIDNVICVIVDADDACEGVLLWAGVTPNLILSVPTIDSLPGDS